MKKLLILAAVLSLTESAFTNADPVLLAQSGSKEKPAHRFESFDDLDEQGIGAGYQPNKFEPPPPPPPKRSLGPIDTWRFESCMKESTGAPTELGVRIGTKRCRDKFGQ